MSNTLDVGFCLSALEAALVQGRPEIFNTDQASQYTSIDFTSRLETEGVRISMDGRRRWLDNGKIERFHRKIKTECIRPRVPLSLDEAQRRVAEYVEHYDNVRLNGAIGYVAPKDKLAGRDQEIFKEGGRKLQAARERRKARRVTLDAPAASVVNSCVPGENETGSAGEHPVKG